MTEKKVDQSLLPLHDAVKSGDLCTSMFKTRRKVAQRSILPQKQGGSTSSNCWSNRKRTRLCSRTTADRRASWRLRSITNNWLTTWRSTTLSATGLLPEIRARWQLPAGLDASKVMYVGANGQSTADPKHAVSVESVPAFWVWSCLLAVCSTGSAARDKGSSVGTIVLVQFVTRTSTLPTRRRELERFFCQTTGRTQWSKPPCLVPNANGALPVVAALPGLLAEERPETWVRTVFQHAFGAECSAG